MLCEKCNIELRLKEVSKDMFNFECIKCGKKLQKTQTELEEEYNKVNKEVK